MKNNDFIKGFNQKQIDLIRRYMSFGGYENYYNLWLYLDACLNKTDSTVPEPNPVCWCGIYHPEAGKVYSDLQEYKINFVMKIK